MNISYVALPKSTITAYGGSGSIHPRAEAKRMITNYRNLHHAYLQSHPNIGFNTIYVNFELNALINALVSLRDNAHADSCRIYFAAHDASQPMPDGFDYKNKQTLIFIGTRTVDGCTEELINDTAGYKLGYDFGTLCPPQCDNCCINDSSIASEVFGTAYCPVR